MRAGLDLRRRQPIAAYARQIAGTGADLDPARGGSFGYAWRF